MRDKLQHTQERVLGILKRESKTEKEKSKLWGELTKERKVTGTFKKVVDTEEAEMRKEREEWRRQQAKLEGELTAVRTQLAERERELKAKEGPPLQVVEPGAACPTCVKRVKEMSETVRELETTRTNADTQLEFMRQACSSGGRLLRVYEQRARAERRDSIERVATLAQQKAQAEQRQRQAELDRDNVLELIRVGSGASEELLRRVAEMRPIAVQARPAVKAAIGGLSVSCHELLDETADGEEERQREEMTSSATMNDLLEDLKLTEDEDGDEEQESECDILPEEVKRNDEAVASGEAFVQDLEQRLEERRRTSTPERDASSSDEGSEEEMSALAKVIDEQVSTEDDGIGLAAGVAASKQKGKRGGEKRRVTRARTTNAPKK